MISRQVYLVRYGYVEEGGLEGKHKPRKDGRDLFGVGIDGVD